MNITDISEKTQRTGDVPALQKQIAHRRMIAAAL